MGRRKTKEILIRNLSCYKILLNELKDKPELKGFDLLNVKLILKGNKPPVRIRNIDIVIENVRFYLSKNRNLIKDELINKGKLARILKTSRETLNKWIKAGYIQPTASTYIKKHSYFDLEDVLDKLLHYKNNH